MHGTGVESARGAFYTIRDGDTLAVIVLGVEADAQACGRTPALDVRLMYRPDD